MCMISYSFYENDTRIQQYVKALTDRGDEVDIISLRRPGFPEEQQFDRVTIHRIQERKVQERGKFSYAWRLGMFFWRTLMQVARLHHRKKFDVVHVHSVPDFLIFSAAIPKWAGAALILDIHDILPEFYASKFSVTHDSLPFSLMLLAERASVAFANRTIVANEIWNARIEERCGANGKCITIRNYPDERIFQPRAKSSSDGFAILYPGTLNHHQGLDLAVKAFSQVVEKMPNAVFDIYGEGPAKPSLQDLIVKFGLEQRVRLHDFLPVDQIATVMAAADLAVVPKRASDQFGTEAASTKILEFMSVGVPVIVSRTKIDTSYFDDSLVMFFDSDDAEQLAAAMLKVYSDPVLRNRLRANGLEYARQNCWTTRRRDYLDLVDSLIRAKRTA